MTDHIMAAKDTTFAWVLFYESLLFFSAFRVAFKENEAKKSSLCKQKFINSG